MAKRGRPRSVVRLVAIAALSAALGCGLFRSEVEVSEEARADLVGDAKLLHEVTTTNPAGSPVVQIKYLVLALPGRDDFVVAREAKNLTRRGWSTRSATTAGVIASSEERNATASITLLSDYLGSVSDDDVREGDVAAELRKEFPEPDGLLLIVVQPREA